MNKHELLKQAGYSEEFIHSLKEYEKASSKRIEVEQPDLVSEKLETYDSAEHVFTVKSNNQGSRMIQYN